ncbi:uncharacterized protein EAF01_004592 [Botrytis porri]|uniref:uncharacterized protein n=1 Tax=Botrytis porri TaxID=87229 RepID=UPI00190211A1|nr:uncharacterized protein EAF01_004592 [Botrytis porri]KAF7907005.1 hypothetical protein EAF01_004592 [Botrytis porri]
MPFKKGMQWLCCLALDSGLLTSNEDEQSQVFEAEAESFSQKPHALRRASTCLPLIYLSSRPMSVSQLSPTHRTIQKPHHMVDDVSMVLLPQDCFPNACLIGFNGV